MTNLLVHATYEDGAGCSKTSERKIQTTGNHPKERMQHSQQGESLKSRVTHIFSGIQRYLIMRHVSAYNFGFFIFGSNKNSSDMTQQNTSHCVRAQLSKNNEISIENNLYSQPDAKATNCGLIN